MKLYELTEQYMQLLEMAYEGVFDQQMINDTLEGVSGEIEEKADSYAKLIRNIEGDIESVKAEIDRLVKKKTVMENNVSALKRNLEGAMIATGKTKFKTALFGFGIQKNAPSLDVIDGQEIPSEFWLPQPDKLDRRAALDYVKQNGEQPWGRIKQTESLRIR